MCPVCRGTLASGSALTQLDQVLCRECQKSPAKQVRALLARLRDRAWPFDDAWEQTVGRVVVRPDGRLDLVGGRVRWPHDTTHRLEWKAILADEWGREVWRRAYCRVDPAACDKPLVALAAA